MLHFLNVFRDKEFFIKEKRNHKKQTENIFIIYLILIYNLSIIGNFL